MGALQGHLDGAYRTISNLHITDMSNIGQSVGLFRVNIGSIKNLHVQAHISIPDDTIYDRWVGVFAGVNRGTIINCSSGVMDGKDYMLENYSRNTYVGGISGISNGGRIEYCGNLGRIYSMGNTGGITGACDFGGIIMYSSNNGAISYDIKQSFTFTHASQNRSIGGIVGRNYNGFIEECINRGLIQYMGGSSSSTILQPHIGQIIGYGATFPNSGNTWIGSVNSGNLTWVGNHNQALYVGNRERGR